MCSCLYSSEPGKDTKTKNPTSSAQDAARLAGFFYMQLLFLKKHKSDEVLRFNAAEVMLQIEISQRLADLCLLITLAAQRVLHICHIAHAEESP